MYPPIFRMLEAMNTDSQPLVSVIVPVYNVANHIEECIGSLINQTYPHIELLLVDDCGTDNSIELVTALLSNSSVTWKLLRHDKNRGLSAARNTGVDAATGDYLYFIDSDDFLDKNALSILVSKAQETQAEMVMGNYQNYYQDGTTKQGFATRTNKSILEPDPLKGYIQQRYAPMAWNKLIKSSWYKAKKVRFIEGILHEDEPWSLILAFQCNKISYVNDIIYFYRQREGSIMHSSDNAEKKIQARIKWQQIAHSFLKEVETRDKIKHDYTKWLNTCILYLFTTIIHRHYAQKEELLTQLLKCAYAPQRSECELDIHYRMYHLLLFSKSMPVSLAYEHTCNLYEEKCHIRKELHTIRRQMETQEKELHYLIHYSKNRRRYYYCRIMSRLTFGKKKRKYKEQVRALREKLRQARAFRRKWEQY